MSAANLQLDNNNKLRHFLSIEGLSREHLIRILDTAESFLNLSDRSVKKVPALRGKAVANLFFENSTRTRTTFELAAKRLSADVLNLNISTSATAKGESLLDTLRNLEAMHVDILATSLPHQVDLIVSAMAMHHVEDTNRLLRAFAEHLGPGGRVALADLDSEDGSFHPPDTEGVYHRGFDRDALREKLEAHGFADIEFATAVEVDRDSKRYPVFLVTATRV